MKNFKWLFIILIIILLGGFVLAMYKNGQAPDEVAVCTMEALLCPDGSGVGRAGAMCQFTTCPNMASYTGRLTQTEDGFILVMSAPEGTTEEVTYAMPLKFSRVSNALADFVGEEVVVKGAFAYGNTLEVDTIEKAGQDGTTGEIKVGETKFINGVRITFHKIVEDSRCPIDAICIQEGKLVLNATLKSDTDEEKVDFTNNAKPRAFDTWNITLLSTTPYPSASAPVPFSEYKATFKVENL